jgi:hypothetical protein
MSEEPENLVLVYLRRIEASMADLRTDMVDLKHRMTAVEIQVGSAAATEQSHYASIAIRLDRLDGRMERIERRLDLVEGSPA